ncbi:hypothetical protein NDR77_24665 [Pseudomonas aeruginosa]|uniref:Uncharacterized protein n=1 Tax=Pseudomonas phage YMC11/02/R656 TaxID=1755689 RepID=A0A0S2SY74_9CAUD|nr:hypothetical protein [Pseudomonas aeruginosa]YP_009187471.1 hypothetical protein AU162_gp074 [Pseudomonas phage YMC11/02/R656]ALP47895.1 hypothetical protein BPPAER656_00740 [Pseudomonas phage YMC11/02/R656]AYZ83539.1 hypothetical protein EGY27_12050 [Pseudomonas aeruginosa]KJC14104.1 hypothetical protein TO65_30330 [Pseudomonas aeruginosa]KYO85130.1 hypothetical protein LT19_05164 [Pseudomonas aeruginosa]MBF2899846.1 hypothetical protein [Pseudomonas aeruginosa]
MTIVYEPHPITPERKAELRAMGYRIVDAAFAPLASDAARGQEQPAIDDDLDGMDAEQLHALAKARGVSVHRNAGPERVRKALREASE